MLRRSLLAHGIATAMPFFVGVSHAQSVKRGSTPLKKTAAYGLDPAQQLDIYLPAGDCYAWVLMVHGGGWRRGDKSHARTVDNKVARWNQRGIAVVSMNYRMLPEHPIETQVQDVRQAMSFLQRRGATLGLIGPMVLMGHSAGGHLVALVSSQIQTTLKASIGAWAGTVVLDSGALDVPRTMQRTKLPMYKNAFGTDPQRWLQLSPVHQVQPGVLPTLVVYSTTRRDDIAEQSVLYAQRLSGSGVVNVGTLGVTLSHGDINEKLGLDNDYTSAVEQFLATLHPSLSHRFKP